jgi:chromosome segregation ATPase
MRQDLQHLRDQLTQSQCECELQRKQLEAQKGEMTEKLVEQQQLVTQLKEATSGKAKETEDELSLSKRQLQDLQGQLMQSQSQGEVQRKQLEAQKSEMAGKLVEQQRLVAKLKEATSSKAKETEDELSLSNRDLVSTRRQLQDLQGQLTQSQHGDEMQRKQHEAQKSELSGKLKEQRQLVAELTEQRDSVSRNANANKDELSLSDRSLAKSREEVQRKGHISEMTRALEEQRRLVTKLTEEKDSMSRKAKENGDELALSNRNLDSTRQQLQMLRDRVEPQRKQDQDHISDMTGPVEEQRGLVAQLMEERDSMSKKAKEMQDELSRSNRELERQLQILWNRLLESRRQWEAQRKQDDPQRLQSEDKATRAKLHELQTEHAQVLALLKIRTDELAGAYSFLDKADLLPVADVTAMVDALNSEIFNTAASIADSLQFRKVKAAAGNEQKIAYERVRSQLGPKVAFLLTSVSHAEDAMLLQFALQCRLVWDCKTIIESWGFGKLQDHLVEIYEGVRKTGKLHNVWRCFELLTNSDRAPSSVRQMACSGTRSNQIAAQRARPHVTNLQSCCK